MTDHTTAEEAVRRYLLYIEDPALLRDERAIAKATRAVNAATDPLDRLRAIAVLHQHTNIDEGPLRAGFIASAKPWADTENVPGRIFRKLNVPDDVLLSAGLVTSSSSLTPRAARSRSKPVASEDIRRHILAIDGVFRADEIVTGTDCSPKKARHTLNRLISEGLIESLGRDRDFRGRGAAPILYQRR
jgi:hypothetical protein